MASEDRHITRIQTTEALFRTNGDAGQSAILTDQNEEWVYYNDDKSLLYYAAAQKTWNGAAWAYVNNDFGQVTLHDDLLVEEYIKRSGGTDDLIRFENDKISIQAGGTVAATYEDDLINLLVATQIGDAGTPAAASVLQVQKDQNAATELRVMNDTGGTGAYAGLKVWANSASGLLAAYDDAYTGFTEFTDKVVLSTGSTALALVASTGAGVIELYAGGTASANKVMVFKSDNIYSELTRFGLGTAIIKDWDASYTTVLQMDARNSIASISTRLFINHNAYFDSDDGRWEYIGNTAAVQFGYIGDGLFAIYGAGAGSADAEITWIKYMVVSETDITFNSEDADIDFIVYDDAGVIFQADAALHTIGVGVAPNAAYKLYAIAPDAQSTINVALYSESLADAVTNYGLLGYSHGGGGTNNIGVWGGAANATNNYCFYGEFGDAFFAGNTGLGVLATELVSINTPTNIIHIVDTVIDGWTQDTWDGHIEIKAPSTTYWIPFATVPV